MAASLDQILSVTRERAAGLRASRPALERAAARAPAPMDFGAALRGASVGLIAEVKRRSPSAGVIRDDIEAVSRAKAYARSGASAISVLTDGPFFGGSLNDLAAVVPAAGVPVLRKDFILVEEQILEARAAGAAAVLLIVKALSGERLRALHACAAGLGLSVLVEVHDAGELHGALAAGASIVGVNSRDLGTFVVDTAAWALLEQVPAHCVAVAESGMASVADVRLAAAAGADAVLIGSALSVAIDPEPLIRDIVQVPRRGR